MRDCGCAEAQFPAEADVCDIQNSTTGNNNYVISALARLILLLVAVDLLILSSHYSLVMY